MSTVISDLLKLRTLHQICCRVHHVLSFLGISVCLSGVWWKWCKWCAEEDGWHPEQHRALRSSHLKQEHLVSVEGWASCNCDWDFWATAVASVGCFFSRQADLTFDLCCGTNTAVIFSVSFSLIEYQWCQRWHQLFCVLKCYWFVWWFNNNCNKSKKNKQKKHSIPQMNIIRF